MCTLHARYYVQAPPLVTGISRPADALLIEDIAREEGYVLAASFDARNGCCLRSYSRPGWSALARFVSRAGDDWPEALAAFAARQDERVSAPQPGSIQPCTGRPDIGLVLGWVLTPRR